MTHRTYAHGPTQGRGRTARSHTKDRKPTNDMTAETLKYIKRRVSTHVSRRTHDRVSEREGDRLGERLRDLAHAHVSVHAWMRIRDRVLVRVWDRLRAPRNTHG